MRVNKVTNFVAKIEAILKRYPRNYIKDLIGDSTNNNRAVSVQQLIRFLEIFNVELAEQVTAVYAEVRSDVAANRFFNYRTDAIDVNEFLTFLTDVDTSTVRTLGRVLSKAA